MYVLWDKTEFLNIIQAFLQVLRIQCTSAYRITVSTYICTNIWLNNFFDNVRWCQWQQVTLVLYHNSILLTSIWKVSRPAICKVWPAGPMQPFYLCNAAHKLIPETWIKTHEIWWMIILASFMQKRKKNLFCNTTLLDFYKLYLPHDKSSVLINHAQQMISLPQSIYLSKFFFSETNITNNSYRCRLNDEKLMELSSSCHFTNISRY